MLLITAPMDRSTCLDKCQQRVSVSAQEMLSPTGEIRPWNAIAGAPTDAPTVALWGFLWMSSHLATWAESHWWLQDHWDSPGGLPPSLPLWWGEQVPWGRGCSDVHEKQDLKSYPGLQGTMFRSQEVSRSTMFKMRGAGNPWENMLANLFRNSYLSENSLENKAVTCLSFFRNVTLPTMIFQFGRSYTGNEGVPGQSLTCCIAIS